MGMRKVKTLATRFEARGAPGRTADFEHLINLTTAKAPIGSEWQKGLDFGRKQSVSVAAIYGPLGPS